MKITSLSNMKNNDNTLTNNELPKMKLRKKNDFERIKENLLKRDGIEFDEKLLKKLSDKHKKYISKQTYSFLKTNENNKIICAISKWCFFHKKFIDNKYLLFLKNNFANYFVNLIKFIKKI